MYTVTAVPPFAITTREFIAMVSGRPLYNISVGLFRVKVGGGFKEHTQAAD